MDLFETALAAHKAGDLEAAERGYRAALDEAPAFAEAWGNLGILLLARGDATGAEAAQRQAVALRPDKAPNHYNLGNALWRQRRLPEAREAYAAAYAIWPDLPGLRTNYAYVLLCLGEWELGWALYDERPQRRNTEAWRLGFPEWRGEPLAGKRLFVWPEQGYGDQLLTARFIERLGAAEVTLVVLPALVRLFSHLPARIVPRDGPVHVEPHDYWSLPLSLPRWLTPPIWTGPYLRGDAGERRGRIGVAWRGNAQPDPGRSLPETLGRRLLGLPGAVSLAPEDTGARDFQETADIIAGLDVVVSIDTSVASLAGALGKPVWLLLQDHVAEWRWEQPWFPTAQIFRQPQPGDWAGAVAAVEAAWRARAS